MPPCHTLPSTYQVHTAPKYPSTYLHYIPPSPSYLTEITHTSLRPAPCFLGCSKSVNPPTRNLGPSERLDRCMWQKKMYSWMEYELHWRKEKCWTIVYSILGREMVLVQYSRIPRFLHARWSLTISWWAKMLDYCTNILIPTWTRLCFG